MTWAQLTLALGYFLMALNKALGLQMRLNHHKGSLTPSDMRVIPVVLISHPAQRVLSASNKRLQTVKDR